MFFADLPLAPADPLFGIKSQFEKDQRQQKVFLTIGMYQTESSQTRPMSAVYKAACKVAKKDTSAGYLPIDGFTPYIKEVGQLVFGDFALEEQDLIYGAQTVGGTSALRIGGEFLKRQGVEEIYLSEPTWANHKNIFRHCGMQLKSYPYYNADTLDFTGLRLFLEKLPAKSVVVLQPCCHNPTGEDLTDEQWEILADLFRERKLFAFFDFAYLGFGEGREQDCQAVRIFLQKKMEFLLAFSASKNFSLYKQRTGALFAVASCRKDRDKAASHIKAIIRADYSNPPAFGAQIVYEVLSCPELKVKWQEELEDMRQRIVLYRGRLARLLGEKVFYLQKQKGLFSLLPLNKEQIARLREKYALYLPDSGRINIAGVNSQNLDYVASALQGVLK